MRKLYLVIGLLALVGCTQQPTIQPATPSPSESHRPSLGASPSAYPAVDVGALLDNMRSACQISTFLDDVTCEQLDGVAMTLTVRTRLVPGAVDGRAAAICQDVINYFTDVIRGGNEYGFTGIEILDRNGEIAARCDFR